MLDGYPRVVLAPHNQSGGLDRFYSGRVFGINGFGPVNKGLAVAGPPGHHVVAVNQLFADFRLVIVNLF